MSILHIFDFFNFALDVDDTGDTGGYVSKLLFIILFLFDDRKNDSSVVKEQRIVLSLLLLVAEL